MWASYTGLGVRQNADAEKIPAILALGSLNEDRLPLSHGSCWSRPDKSPHFLARILPDVVSG
jgi:hypothetical protein